MKNPLADGTVGQLHGKMRDLVRNPFRDKFMVEQFQAAILTYDTKHKNLMYPSGRRCIGNAWATNFWRGFEGMGREQWARDTVSRKTPAYAFWRAGVEIAKAIEAAEKQNRLNS